ncbi:MAG: hypothetical protein ACREMK_06990 [Gemmatimonadota bacterium]
MGHAGLPRCGGPASCHSSAAQPRAIGTIMMRTMKPAWTKT